MKLAAIFKDGMVLQQNQVNRVWGTCKAGEKVTVQFLGNEYDAVNDDGKWHVDLMPAKVGGPFTMMINSDSGQSVEIKDILVGEVWFAGGQSNMELELRNSDNGAVVSENADYDWIRYYNVPKHATVDDKLIELEEGSQWKCAKGSACGDMSAVAFYFAKSLFVKLQVPIGIIDCYWGGTSATCWIPRERILGVNEVSDYVKEWDDIISSKNPARYEEEVDKFNKEYEKWIFDEAKLRKEKPDITWNEILEAIGNCPWEQPKGSGSPFRPFGLYESMVKRVVPYGIRGFIYYQAEEDHDRADYYAKLNQAVIDQWREDFCPDEKKDIPFIITQLPMFIEKGQEDKHTFARLREQQSRVFRNNENMGMAVLIDCGEFDNVHPTDKETPGKRLALQALGRFYGKAARFDNMQIDRASFLGDSVMLSFNNTYGEIRVRFTDSSILTAGYDESEVPAKIIPPEKIFGFELSGDGEAFFPAKVLVVGNKLKISSDNVAVPKEVRYGFMDYGVVNVYNAAGLPLEPFRICCDVAGKE